MDVDLAAPVHLLKGGDDVLLEEAAVELVRALVGEADRSLVVEELSAEQYDTDDGYDIAALVDAAQTPPFLTDRRVVVARNAAVFSTKDAVAPLVAYLADPLPTTSLVLVWEKDTRPGRGGAKLAGAPKSLSDAIAGCGGAVVDVSPGRGKQATTWVDDRLRDAGVNLDTGARAAVVAHCGDELNRLPSILATLEGVYGTGARLSVADVEPYLGEAGDVAPWDLTDAIDAGDVPLALDRLHRMLAGGGRHPLQVMATLTNHYLRMLRLDDPTIRGEKQAAEVLGIKGSTFPAKKALKGAQDLGSDRLAEMVGLLAVADLDLHGAKAWPPELVIEVLVARLAGRSRAARRR